MANVLAKIISIAAGESVGKLEIKAADANLKTISCF